jgi:hypothetical protein
MAHGGVEYAQLFEFDVADDDFDSAATSQMLAELLGKEDGAMLAASAAKAHH